MKSITILIWLLRFFGVFSIVSGFWYFGLAVLGPTFLLLPILASIQAFLGGLALLFLAQGLYKKEKWAWYTALIIFTLGFFSSIVVRTFLTKVSVEQYFFAILIYILLFGLLIKGKQPFIEQPKEKISQWFRKPYFIIVVVGILIWGLIGGGVSVWQYFEALEKAEMADWETYRNEEYRFELKYPPELVGLEVIYEGDGPGTPQGIQFRQPGTPTGSLPPYVFMAAKLKLASMKGPWILDPCEVPSFAHIKDVVSTTSKDISGMIFTKNEVEPKERALVYVRDRGISYIGKKEGVCYRFLYDRYLNFGMTEEDDLRFEQILSTFRFLE